MNSCMLFVCPKPGITSVQNSSNKARNCDNEVQNKTDNKLAWEWILWPTFPLILTAFSSTIKEVAEIPLKGKTKQLQQNTFIAVWLLKPGHLREDCLIPKIFENKRFSSFFLQMVQWHSRFNYTTVAWKTLKPFELTWPLWKQPQNLWFLLVCLKKKTRESLEIVVIGQSSSNCPGSSSCTVIDIFSSVYWFAIFEGCTKTRSSKYLKANGEEA